MSERRIILLEVPYMSRGAPQYIRKCIRHSLARGEIPVVGSLLGGVDASVIQEVDQVSLYVDYGTSKAMREVASLAAELGVPVTKWAIGKNDA